MPGYRRREMERHVAAIRAAIRDQRYHELRKAPRTPWYPRGTHPARPGYYERRFCDGTYLQYWDGKVWRADEDSSPHWRQVNDYPEWRGLLRRSSTTGKGT